MKSLIIPAAFVLICIGITATLEDVAEVQAATEQEYERFCNDNPAHLRCADDMENV